MGNFFHKNPSKTEVCNCSEAYRIEIRIDVVCCCSCFWISRQSSERSTINSHLCPKYTLSLIYIYIYPFRRPNCVGGMPLVWNKTIASSETLKKETELFCFTERREKLGRNSRYQLKTTWWGLQNRKLKMSLCWLMTTKTPMQGGPLPVTSRVMLYNSTYYRGYNPHDSI